MNLEIFKAYDIRGIYPGEIDEDAAYRIGKAFAEYLKPQKVALGRDVRLSGQALWEACAKGLTEMGVDVVDLGVISTDMLYFAVANYKFDGGLTVSASHNDKQYNGFKLVRENSIPISSDSGLMDIKKLVVENHFTISDSIGKIEKLDILDDYVAKNLTFIDKEKIKPLKVLVNPNFGAAGKAIEKIAEELGLELVRLNFEADGNFPKGKPDPMIPELRIETSENVRNSHAVMGVAWDADADRCFWYDEKGRFVDGYYEGVVLSKTMLKKYPKSKILHDVRLIWGAQKIISDLGGTPIMTKPGHAFIKERMRKENAVFAFENSAHIYFKDYYFCDNGLIPWLMILEEMSVSGKKLSEIVDEIRFAYPISEEVNFKVNNPDNVIKDIEEAYENFPKDYTDGVSIDTGDIRFNIRKSNTEPVIRLNVEAKSRDLLDPKKAEIIAIIKKDLAAL